jgi:hypothetical protein
MVVYIDFFRTRYHMFFYYLVANVHGAGEAVVGQGADAHPSRAA